MWRVAEIQEGRGFVWITRAPGVSVRAHHWVESEGGGTTATLSLRFDGLLGGLVGLATAGLNSSYLDIEAESLKRRCELSPAKPAGAR